MDIHFQAHNILYILEIYNENYILWILQRVRNFFDIIIINMDNNSALFLVVITIIIVAVLWCATKKDKFRFDNSMYQYSNPSLNREKYYYNCVGNECGGNTFDYPCLEKCHLKSFRHGMQTKDHADWVCYNYRNDKDAYYKCLDAVYADYRFP